MLATLTEIELLGLQSQCNMADGHAYHDLNENQINIIQRLPEIWNNSVNKTCQQAERDFRDAFLTLARTPSLSDYKYFRICPTASNSIDIVATWLKATDKKVALVEPTFDNLALILRRRGVSLQAVPEHVFEQDNFNDALAHSELEDFDALFLVNPNNPTGKNLTEEQFRRIVSWCTIHGKTIILDCTFRFFVEQSYDHFQILLDSGVTFISLEDTGKVWPTQDLKASLIFFSADIATLFNVIYEEIYLCVSNFQLELLREFLIDTHQRGLDTVVWKELKARREEFREVIRDTILSIQPGSENSTISVDWVKIQDGYGSDFDLIEFLKQKGLVVLPGRHFYWNSHGSQVQDKYLRFSLLKPRKQFVNSLAILREGLEEICKINVVCSAPQFTKSI